MQTRVLSKRFVLIGVGTLAVLVASLFLWIISGRYTAQLIQTIEDETAIECLARHVNYSFLTGRLVLEQPELRISPGVTLKSDEVTFHVDWTSLWSDSFILDEIEIKRPNFYINSELFGRRLFKSNLRFFLQQTEKFAFTDGSLTFKSAVSSNVSHNAYFVFQSLTLDTDSDDQFKFQVVGKSDQWQMEGVIIPGRLRLTGQVMIEELPLQRVFDSGYLLCDQCKVSGQVSTDLALGWSKNTGLELEGSAEIGNGEYTSASGGVVSWEKMIAEGVQYRRASGSIKTLTIYGGDAEFNNNNYLNQLHDLFHSGLKNQLQRLVYHGSLRAEQNGYSDVITGINSVVDIERKASSYFYQASGQWMGKTFFSIEGLSDYSDPDRSRFRLSAPGLMFSPFPLHFRVELDSQLPPLSDLLVAQLKIWNQVLRSRVGLRLSVSFQNMRREPLGVIKKAVYQHLVSRGVDKQRIVFSQANANPENKAKVSPFIQFELLYP